jgi:alpha-L-rhamnosidase
LGKLQTIQGKAAHPKGMIEMDLHRSGASGVQGQINLPPGINGVFVWNKKKIPLVGGTQKISIK